MREIKPFEQDELEELTEIIGILRKNGSILKSRINPQTRLMQNDKNFDRLYTIREQVGVLLSVFGITLRFDPISSIFYIESDERQLLTQEQCYVLVLLRKIYDDQMRGESLEPYIMTTKKEIRNYGEDTALITSPLTQEKWNEIFAYLKKNNVITYAGTTKNIEDDTPIFILDTIRIVLNNEKMQIVLGGIDETKTDTEAEQSDTE